jgi:hypothetical protein
LGGPLAGPPFFCAKERQAVQQAVGFENPGHCEDTELAALAAREGTPLHVYSKARSSGASKACRRRSPD